MCLNINHQEKHNTIQQNKAKHNSNERTLLLHQEWCRALWKYTEETQGIVPILKCLGPGRENWNKLTF